VLHPVWLHGDANSGNPPEVLRLGSATANTCPPRPPSPPLGPPNSLYFSCRNDTQPCATITCGNVNKGFIDELHQDIQFTTERQRRRATPPESNKAPSMRGTRASTLAPAHALNNQSPDRAGLRLLPEESTSGGSHVDRGLGQRTLGAKRHMAVHQGATEAVILADSDIAAGVEASAALAHDDRTSTDQFTTERLDTPSIFGLESRPFRVEPPPFFCAMTSAPS
jgi:hypothetical protein